MALGWERDYVCAYIQHIKRASYTTDSNYAELKTALLTRVNDMKTVRGRKAPRCDEEQFCEKMMRICFREIVLEHSGLNKKVKLLRLAVFRVAFGV